MALRAGTGEHFEHSMAEAMGGALEIEWMSLQRKLGNEDTGLPSGMKDYRRMTFASIAKLVVRHSGKQIGVSQTVHVEQVSLKAGVNRNPNRCESRLEQLTFEEDLYYISDDS